MSVNLSARQIREPSVAAMIAEVIQSTGVRPEQLVLEITESVLIAEGPGSLRVLRELKDIGVQLAVDDFGTGYSSLGYLKRFPVDIVKIDRVFVNDIADDGDDAAIAGAIIQLGQALGLRVIAEGVEQPRQADELRRLGCGHAQGFLFSRPVPSDEVTDILGWPIAALDEVHSR